MFTADFIQVDNHGHFAAYMIGNNADGVIIVSGKLGAFSCLIAMPAAEGRAYWTARRAEGFRRDDNNDDVLKALALREELKREKRGWY